ncbi:TfuA-like protein [Altericista sp. CCNU0014]|uniref:TfuA-like protein n=1 Tax=Altericista sp. CCNU0014 TaxID=3082949 RepID=UPI00384BE1C8
MSLGSLRADEIFVFLGPTLPLDEATELLPARYLEPARCGDVLAYLRLDPKVIAIVDGVFDRNASVWHKEILWAMERGIQVFGASSMGALRAAELHHFGMKGVGEIFAAYQSGQYTDDDEVAVAHGNAAEQFRCFSDAMVNIRATVAHAIDRQAIDPELGERIVQRAKQTFYPQRLLRHTIAELVKEGANALELKRFADFLDRGGFVNLKRRDAICLLQHLNEAVRGKIALSPSSPIALNKSMFIVELQARVALRPLRTRYEWLPVPERVAQEARLLGATYWQLRNLAGLLRWCCFLADRLQLEPTPEDLTDILESEDIGIASLVRQTDWAIAQDLTPSAQQGFVYRLGQIQALRRTAVGRYSLPKRIAAYEKLLLQLSAGKEMHPEACNTSAAQLHGNLRIQCNTEKIKLLRQVTFLWSLAAQCTAQTEISLQPNILQKMERHLLEKYGFSDGAAWKQWLHQYQNDSLALTDPTMELIHLEGMVHQYRWWTRIARPIDPTLCFLPDALRMSGFYTLLKACTQPLVPSNAPAIRRTDSNSLFEQWCAENVSFLSLNLEQIAFWLDFSDSEDFIDVLLTKYSQEPGQFWVRGQESYPSL